MTYAEAIGFGAAILAKAGIENPSSEAAMFLCSAVYKDKAYIYSHPLHELSEGETGIFTDNIFKRAGHVPAQYLLGRQEFMSIIFQVNSSVLIPRPETELLAEAALLHLADRDAKVLDIGTGSGCLAVSIAYHNKRCRVTAADISKEALKIAAINAAEAGVADRVEFVCSNLFDNLKRRSFDVILSNPPYIPTGDLPELDSEVRLHEPSIALDGGSDGLDIIRRLIREAPPFLNPGGLLAIEIGINQSEAVQKLFTASFSEIGIIKDFQGIPRIIKGKKR